MWAEKQANWKVPGKKFSTNKEVIAETEAYFGAKDKSYDKNGIEKLEDRYNRCIALECNYILNNKIEVCQKKCVLLWSTGDFSIGLLRFWTFSKIKLQHEPFRVDKRLHLSYG